METHLVEMQKRLVDLQSERDLLRSQLKRAEESLTYCHDEIVDHLNHGQDCGQCKLRVRDAKETLSAIRKVGAE